MYEAVLQRIIDYWKGVIDDDSIEVLPESNLMDDLASSSLEMFNSLLILEDEYDITLPEKTLRQMVTIEDTARVITEFIRRKEA